ncbi:MerR family transcriptional regulator [Microbacterium esteraromaticum]|uniref:MerR family transcriptional regulator n=1 Tax=Microbacterium esteraromaticum TaxID=57043 RepID=UPI001C961CEA|nr:MerR family transcriptional regulator [Microbacterium esteraromaticum]MBY6060148.1 MerR family transcriptional regulator [Microbacterium esteraromaticum]
MQNPQEYASSTAELAHLVGYSTQQVRDLERLGVLPPAERAANGYRQYRAHHVVALRAYRSLAAAIGPVPARALMPTLRTASIDVAAERIDLLHLEIAQQRQRVREALSALDAIVEDSTVPFDETDTMAIGELAEALGVRASALRHWEEQGLVLPRRDDRSGARRYGADAIAAARITAALRAGGYPLPPIRRVIDLIRAHGDSDDTRMLLRQRLGDLTGRSVALLAASADLHALIVDSPPATPAR